MTAPSTSPSNLQDILRDFTPVSKGLAAILTLSYAIQLIFPPLRPHLLSFFGLVPGSVIVKPWQVLTSGLIEGNIIGLILSITGLLFLARIIEPHYGTRSFLKFLLASLAACGTMTFICLTFWYYIITIFENRGNGDHLSQAGYLLYNPICGFQGGLAAMLVAVKQVIPDNEVSLFGGALYFKARHLPTVYILLTSVIALPLHEAAKIIPFVVFGAYSGWLYLRFFNENGGDGSEEFSFASFFPEPLQPVAENVAQRTSKFTKLGISRGDGSELYNNNNNSSTNSSSAILGLLPAADDAAAARRRERGVKALEQRLGSMKKIAAKTGGGGTSSQVKKEESPAVVDDVETGVQQEEEKEEEK